MAISRATFELLKMLRGTLPQGGSLLEIGEANWYGDCDPAEIEALGTLPDECRHLLRSESLFDVSKALYAALFQPSRIVAVDANGTPAAMRDDLNEPLSFFDTFDVVINHGTAEHVFNIAQVFATIHDHCTTGGLMIHEAPLSGWIDHGFYCLQPTLFYDVAKANGYEVALAAMHTINPPQVVLLDNREHVARMTYEGLLPPNPMLFFAFRKVLDRAFRIPRQGYYAGDLSPAAQVTWKTLR